MIVIYKVNLVCFNLLSGISPGLAADNEITFELRVKLVASDNSKPAFTVNVAFNQEIIADSSLSISRSLSGSEKPHFITESSSNCSETVTNGQVVKSLV